MSILDKKKRKHPEKCKKQQIKKSCFWAPPTVLSCYRNWWCSHCGQRLRWSALADKINTIVSDKVNYRGAQFWRCVVDGGFAKSGKVVFGRRRQPDIPPKHNYYFLAHLQCSLKFACKFIPWYLHQVDRLTSKKYAKIVNLVCAGKKVFVKYQAQRGF